MVSNVHVFAYGNTRTSYVVRWMHRNCHYHNHKPYCYQYSQATSIIITATLWGSKESSIEIDLNNQDLYNQDLRGDHYTDFTASLYFCSTSLKN